MKNLILFFVTFGNLLSFSTKAAVVAEDTAEHTISFNFARPSADVYLCQMYLERTPGNRGLEHVDSDRMTFPDGSSITSLHSDGGGGSRNFGLQNTPSSSTLHLGSSEYGVKISLGFCHVISVPGSDHPAGTMDSFYKIITPSSWSYFSNANVQGYLLDDFYSLGIPSENHPSFPLTSNTSSDYSMLKSIPFAANQELKTTYPQSSMTWIFFTETASGLRPSSETPGQVVVGFKDEINYN